MLKWLKQAVFNVYKVKVTKPRTQHGRIAFLERIHFNKCEDNNG